MIDQTIPSSTEAPVVDEVLVASLSREADAPEWREHDGVATGAAPRDQYVQWGRCGLVPASMAHEPRA